MKIVSLLPSTTEIICALGKQGQLVGRSHECDFPKEVSKLPACTKPKFEPDGTSYEIDERVKALLQEGLSIYRVDENILASLQPDVVITQDHCEVCAATLAEVQQAVHETLGDHVKVISVSPDDLSSVIESIQTIARAIDAVEAANAITFEMKQKLEHIQHKTAPLKRPDILCIEWMDPLMSAGNWVPQLIELAGGNALAASSGKHSPWLKWEQLKRLDPEIITIAPCGYSIDQTLQEMRTLTNRKGWNRLRAVKNRQVFVMDGNHYFNRPGPRLVDSTQILGEILHPSIFRKSKKQPGWVNLHAHQFRQSLR